MNLNQRAKHQAFSLLCSRDTVDLKILQSDWARTHWLGDYLRNEFFPNMGFVQEYSK